MCIKTASLTLLPLSVFAIPATAQFANPTVIFTEIVASPTSTVPGALDSGGSPVVTNFIALEDLAVRRDGSDWVLKARTAQATTNDSILIRGGPGSPTMFAQDGRPLLGGAAGELYDFFDSPFPAAWDTAGNMVFGARAKGGVAAVFEKVIRVSGATHTIVAQMGDALTGLVDALPSPSGDELLGNSINSIYLLDSGIPSYTITPITNCSSFRYPAIIRDHAGFKQSGVSTIGAEVWDNFVLAGHGGTADGLHWYAEGDTENANTAIDNILAVDDVIVLQEGSPVVSGGPVMAAIFSTRMAQNGDWYCRGDDPADNDWAVRNGVLLAKTGDPLTPGNTELWGPVFSVFTGNANGRWILIGDTNNIDPLQNQVLVVDGTTVLMREGQPLDVDGNGMFDDDAFLASFQGFDSQLTDNDAIYALITLRNGAGTSLGDGMIRVSADLNPRSICFGDGTLVDHTTPCPCGNNGAAGRGCGHSFDASGALLDSTGSVSLDTVVLHVAFVPSTSFTLFMQHDAVGDGVFHDGVLCAGGNLIRLRGRQAGIAGQPGPGEATFPNTNFANDTQTLSQRGMVTVGSGATRYYAGWYRNASTTFCPPATANVTNGQVIVW